MGKGHRQTREQDALEEGWATSVAGAEPQGERKGHWSEENSRSSAVTMTTMGGDQKHHVELNNVKGEKVQHDFTYTQLEMCKTDSCFV